MSGMWGNKLKLSIWGESHGEAIGIVVDGLPSGIVLDMQAIEKEMARRAPNGGEFSTQRKEADKVEILSGFFDGHTTGTPLCAMIRNSNTRSADYGKTKDLPRPSHSDYGYYVQSNGNNDFRGGGHSSGRITAPLVFAGAICKQLLRERGIEICSHLLNVGNVRDTRFGVDIPQELTKRLQDMALPLIDSGKEKEIAQVVADARKQGDSVGGGIEVAICGVSAGVGQPFFNSIESTLAGLLFSVPAVKGIEFGNGFAMTEMFGSQANDQFCLQDGKIKTITNNNGGVCGGIANGMPIVFNVAIKPTPSIYKEQQSVNLATMQEEKLTIEGRHDPCIVVRALPVIESVAAIAIYELLDKD
ncbi:MAG: chorismate synthase [Clostridia bacterium]